MQYPFLSFFLSLPAIVYSIRDIKKGCSLHATRARLHGQGERGAVRSVRLTSDHLKLAGEEVCETHIVKGQQHNVNGQATAGGQGVEDENGQVSKKPQEMLN